MPRYKMLHGGRVQYTAEEEAIRDAEEKAWDDDADNREAARVRCLLYTSPSPRDKA